MAPIDMAYTKMLNDIVLLIVGGIGGVIGKKGVGTALNTFKQPSEPPPAPSPVVQASVAPSVASTNYNWMGFKNADLDESWTPPPPPTTPPDLLENDQDRELLAMARKEVS